MPPSDADAANDPVAAEPLDVLDEAGNPTGVTKRRSQVHLDGDWHRALHLWIVRESDLVVLQRRARGKDLAPLKVDVTVGGHYRAGETFLDVLREAEEELGLEVRPGQLTYLTTARSERHYPEMDPPRIDREHHDVYVLRDDRPLEGYTLAAAEVETLYEVPVDAAIALFESGAPVPVYGFDSQRRVSNALLIHDDVPTAGRETLASELRLVKAWLVGEAAGSF